MNFWIWSYKRGTEEMFQCCNPKRTIGELERGEWPRVRLKAPDFLEDVDHGHDSIIMSNLA